MSARFYTLFVLMFPDDSEKALKLKNNKTEFEQFLKEARYIPKYAKVLNYELLPKSDGKVFAKIIYEG